MLQAFFGITGVLLVAGGLVPFSSPDWEEVFQQGYSSPDSEARYEAVRQIDPNDPRGLELLFRILGGDDPHRADWYIRIAASEAIGRVEEEGPSAEIEGRLRTGSPGVKEGIICSHILKARSGIKRVITAGFQGEQIDRAYLEFLRSLRDRRGEEYIDTLQELLSQAGIGLESVRILEAALKDPSSRVRRAAIKGLAIYPRRGSVPLLIAHMKTLEVGRDWREWVALRTTLEALTGAHMGHDPRDWETWWAAERTRQGPAGPSPRGSAEPDGGGLAPRESADMGGGGLAPRTAVQPKGAGPSPGESVEPGGGGLAERERRNRPAAAVVTARVRHGEVELRYRARGTGGAVLVIPGDGFEASYLEGHLAALEEIARVHYVDLPRVGEFRGLELEAKTGLAYYPVDALCEAFEDLRETLGVGTFALFAHGGGAGMIAQRYVSRFPERVSHLLLVCPHSGEKAYRRILEGIRREGERLGDLELRHLAEALTWDADSRPVYVPSDAGEWRGIKRKGFTISWGDPTDLEAYWMWEDHRIREGGKSTMIPEFDSRKEKHPPIPVLILAGEKCLWADGEDMKHLAKLWPRGEVFPFKESSLMPFVTEASLFRDVVHGFFRKHPIGPQTKETAPGKEARSGHRSRRSVNAFHSDSIFGRASL